MGLPCKNCGEISDYIFPNFWQCPKCHGYGKSVVTWPPLEDVDFRIGLNFAWVDCQFYGYDCWPISNKILSLVLRMYQAGQVSNLQETFVTACDIYDLCILVEGTLTIDDAKDWKFSTA